MEESYINLIAKFKRMDIDDKKDELLKNTYELLSLLYFVNKKTNSINKVLPVLNEYQTDDEYFDQLFTYIISLKEENAKLIKYIDKQ